MPNIGPLELFFILILILIAYGIGKLASNKGQSFWAFFVFGLLLWPIALVVALLIPDRRRQALESERSNIDQLEKLAGLRQSGALTQEEFEREKRRVLRGSSGAR